jgi:hypothetical protein
MNNTNIILSNIPTSITNNNLCQICFSDIKCKQLICNTCQSTTCMMCCNNLSSRSFSIYNNNSNLDNISLIFDCFLCKNVICVPLDKFNKADLITLNTRDYVNHYYTQSKVETLEQLLDNEQYLKKQIIENIINNKDTPKKIKYLLQINKDLQQSNLELIKTIMKQDLDIEEQLNNDISINQLKKQLLQLKL